MNHVCLVKENNWRMLLSMLLYAIFMYKVFYLKISIVIFYNNYSIETYEHEKKEFFLSLKLLNKKKSHKETPRYEIY